MNLTNEMLQAAMKKAVEAGLLPRHACPEDLSVNQELIRLIVQAALDTLTNEAVAPLRPPAPTYRWKSALRRYADVVEVRLTSNHGVAA